LLKGHERSITQVKYNADGDLIFTASKDSKPTAWFSDTGERFGTYGTTISIDCVINNFH
jgi:translation initiation factor 3 subunit I